MRRLLLAALAAALALGAHPRASMDRDDPLEWEGSGRSFRSLTRFMVPDRNSAEIVSATPDGRTLVYTDAVGATLGIVDIGDPSSPVQTATVPIAGSPTSVAVTPDGQWAVVAVAVQAYEEGDDLTTLPAPVPGELWMIALANPAAPPLVYTMATGPGGANGHLPDSVAVTPVGSDVYAVVALENEPIVAAEDGATLRYLAPEPAGVSACPTLAPFEFDGDHYVGCDLSEPGFGARHRQRGGRGQPPRRPARRRHHRLRTDLSRRRARGRAERRGADSRRDRVGCGGGAGVPRQ